jgi:RNA polymerase sigma factor (sigma-70 family)
VDPPGGSRGARRTRRARSGCRARRREAEQDRPLERKLRAELGREPTAAEIGKDLDLSAEEVEHIRRSAQTPVSLEKPVGDEDESEFGHFITDENLPLPDEEAEITLRKETLRKILGTLSSRERQVLELRYGLDGQHPRTLDEVGRTFNVTRERIRQIENQSLKKLRAPRGRDQASRRRLGADSAAPHRGRPKLPSPGGSIGLGYMRKKLVGFVIAAFVPRSWRHPALAAKQPSDDGRAGSTIIARN